MSLDTLSLKTMQWMHGDSVLCAALALAAGGGHVFQTAKPPQLVQVEPRQHLQTH